LVIQCKRCLYTSDHALGIVFNEHQICSGCTIHEEKDLLDWSARWQDLEKLVAEYRTSESKYDCIVPITGAKDSFYTLHLVVNILKMKPLVLAYNKYFNTPVGIANLAKLRIAFDVDFQQKNVDPNLIKEITRKSLHAHGNPYWHCIAGETVFPVQTAVMMKIPLIIWGPHQGVEQVGMFSHLHNVEMSRRYRKDHDLFGHDADNFIGPFDNLNEEDLLNYRYPAFSDIEEIGVRGIYLSNYVRWDPYAQHLDMVNKFSFRGSSLSRTFDAYDHADCYVYSNIHDVLKLYKHGYSKVTDQVCREIRFGRIKRSKGLDIVAYYEAQQPEYMNLFCNWLGVDSQSLQFSMNRHRNKKFWDEIEPDIWVNKKNRTLKERGLDYKIPEMKYPNCKSESYETNEKFITIGKGVNWPHPVIKNKINNKWL
jgi:N-acetyl sugar amidotransferase